MKYVNDELARANTECSIIVVRHLLCLKLMAMLRTLTINSESCAPAQAITNNN
jgi:hypothetical protein